ncbi:MAG: ECF-type sigma factor [Acidobacteriota bacterium]
MFLRSSRERELLSQPTPATDRLFLETYAELKRLAEHRLRQERSEHTLQPTALVHEAYLRLSRYGSDWQDRGHFVGIAARVMRQVLVDWAREKGSLKRGGDRRRVTLDDGLQLALPRPLEILAFDNALSRLAAFDERKARLVELRILGGMTGAELAAELGVSGATIGREWRAARAWIARILEEERTPEDTLEDKTDGAAG